MTEEEMLRELDIDDYVAIVKLIQTAYFKQMYKNKLAQINLEHIYD